MAARRGSKEDVWGLPLAKSWEAAMGRGGDMISAIGGDFAEEEDEKSWQVTMGSRDDMILAGGGDFLEEEDGESWLGTMIFNFKRMTSSLESMEAWITTKQS